MRRLKFFGVMFLAFSVLSAFIILPEVFGSAWLIERFFSEEVINLLKRHLGRVPGVGDRISLYSALVSAAGLGLVSLSLWLAVSSADSQSRTEGNRWLRHMLEEWHSPEMNVARHRWYDEGREKIKESNVASSLTHEVFIIVNFLEKYGRLCEAGALDVSLAKNVFGDYAAWYRDNFFAQVLDSSFYDSRMRAIDRKKYIEHFFTNVASERLTNPPQQDGPPPINNHFSTEDSAVLVINSKPSEPIVVEIVEKGS